MDIFSSVLSLIVLGLVALLLEYRRRTEADPQANAVPVPVRVDDRQRGDRY